MNKKDNYLELLKLVSNKMTTLGKGDMEETCPIGIIEINNWEWPQGVGMYGLYQYYLVTKDKDCFDYMINWYDKKIKEGLPEKNVNTMAPMLTLAFLYEETGKKAYKDLIIEWSEWVMKDMPRTECGGLQHIVTGEENYQQLWDDTLFMTVLFLAKIGMLFDKRDYIEESKKQFLLHVHYLTDRSSGLWYHGWSFVRKDNFANALWARGNCWYTAGVVDYIEIVQLDSALKNFLIEVLKKQIEALAKLQNKNGMWHTLLNDPESYVETSATAGFGYGILKAVRKGYISSSYKECGLRALQAVIERVDGDGTVTEVSYGTGMGHDLDFYKNIILCPMTYGQALAILILNEGIIEEESLV